MNSFDHWALGLAVFIPVGGAALLMLIPRRLETGLSG